MSWIFLVDVENFSSVLFSCVLFLIAMNPRTSSAMLNLRSAPERSSTKKSEHKMKSQQADNAESCKKISSAVQLRHGWWVWREKNIKIKCGMRICALKSSINTATARREELAGIRNGRRWCSPHKKREKQRILARKTNSLIMDDKSVVVVVADWEKLKIIYHPLLLQHWN